MPYDFYDYFLKQRNHPLFIETTNLVRQNLWNERFEDKQSKNWLKTEDKILIQLYHILRRF